MAQILVIDDSFLARHSHGNILREMGHEASEAANGQEGLELMGRQNFDLILVDLMMPEMDGISFLKTLREQRINIPAIVLSADIQESKHQECFSLGARAFLEKPVKKMKLVEVIDKILGA
ncbi:MAG: response regulator [Desulfuromonas sp.]|nr:MAG: response regulator [Desulfuromonas sp.]